MKKRESFLYILSAERKKKYLKFFDMTLILGAILLLLVIGILITSNESLKIIQNDAIFAIPNLLFNLLYVIFSVSLMIIMWKHNRAGWILSSIITGGIGGIIFYFVYYRKYLAGKMNLQKLEPEKERKPTKEEVKMYKKRERKDSESFKSMLKWVIILAIILILFFVYIYYIR